MQESGEMYLETILVLEKRYGVVRSVDVARQLNLARASVSRAIGILKRNGFLTMETNGLLQLTPDGKKKAQNVYERHEIIRDYLINTLDVTETLAEQDACRIEHVISEEIFQKMKEYLKKQRIR